MPCDFTAISTVFQSYQEDMLVKPRLRSKRFRLQPIRTQNSKTSRPALKVADISFSCATFCALPSFGAVTTFSSHTTFFSHKVSVKGSDIDMCSAIYVTRSAILVLVAVQRHRQKT